MEQLKEIIERDQWAELLTDAQGLYKKTLFSEIEILAFTEKEAIKKAVEIFNLSAECLNYTKIKSGSSSFFSIIKKPSVFNFSVKENFKQATTTTSIDYDQYNDLGKNKNGSFRLQMRKKGLILQVFKPFGLGKMVTQEEITKALVERGYLNTNPNLIKKALLQLTPVVVALYSKSDGDSHFNITIAKDNMSASFTFSKPHNNGRIPESIEILKSLAQLGIIYGIEKEYIEDALNNELYNMPITIAEGTLPKNGADAFIEYTFPTGDETFKHAVRSDGSIDFKELNIIHNVFKDSVLAIMHPAIEGVQGRTILGEVLEATSGTPIEWSIGSNVYLSNDQSQAFATSAGQVYLKGKQICVDPALEIKTDVDLSVGNIDFLGNVIIKGNISDGFSVISGGNIEIYGHIGKCFIHAEGNIIARQGIQGKDAAQIECQGDLFAHFIERAQISVGGNLIITKSLLHSKVICGQGIYVTENSKKSLIAGGHLQAQTEIFSYQFGAESYIETFIEVGYSKKIIAEIKTFNNIIKSQDEQVTVLNNQLTMTGDISKIKKIQAEIQRLRALQNSNKDKLTNAQNTLATLRKNATISASRSFMPGVKIKIGDNNLTVNSQQNSGTFTNRESQIVFGKYAPSKFITELQTTTSKKNKK